MCVIVKNEIQRHFVYDVIFNYFSLNLFTTFIFFALFVTQMYWICNTIYILVLYVEGDIHMDTY
jgi:hypothetical protein